MDIEKALYEIEQHRLAMESIKARLNEHYDLVEKIDGKKLSSKHRIAITELVSRGVTKTRIAEILGINRASIYRIIDDKFRLKHNESARKCMAARKRTKRLAIQVS